MTTTTDRIEKKILLRASRARVWRALTDSREFGEWFGVKLSAPFTPGTKMRGTAVPTVADAQVAEMQKKYEGVQFNITVETIEPERLFSFRWHPFAVESGVNYAAEPMTLVEFTLEETKAGILVTVVESGFDRIPIARRAKAFAANEGGWTIVVTLIEKYLAQKS